MLLIMKLDYASENVHKILIGNKSDMEDKRKVSYEEGELLGII